MLSAIFNVDKIKISPPQPILYNQIFLLKMSFQKIHTYSNQLWKGVFRKKAVNLAERLVKNEKWWLRRRRSSLVQEENKTE